MIEEDILNDLYELMQQIWTTILKMIKKFI